MLVYFRKYRYFVGLCNHFLVRVGFHGEFPSYRLANDVMRNRKTPIFSRHIFTLFGHFAQQLRKCQGGKSHLKDDQSHQCASQVLLTTHSALVSESNTTRKMFKNENAVSLTVKIQEACQRLSPIRVSGVR